MIFAIKKKSFASPVVRELFACVDTLGMDAWVVGGTVRDWLLDTQPKDLDLLVSGSADQFCRCLLRHLGEGSLVPLGVEGEEACRVVWRGQVVDVSSFRGAAVSVEEDLALRDFTINSMALPLTVLAGKEVKLIDPMQGLGDLRQGLLKHCSHAFALDPLRILRGFRFAACNDLTIVDTTLVAMATHVEDLVHVASERIAVELDYIITSKNSAESIRRMHRFGILALLFPELTAGAGLEQPNFHHLDVFEHSVAALEHMTHLVSGDEVYYPADITDVVIHFDNSVKKQLCWAALFHDLGKPVTHAIRADKNNRVTFYAHDEVGGDLVRQIAKRLRWSKENRETVAHLVTMHMHPFHLCSVQEKGEISRRAALKLYRRAGDLLLPLFMLAMSDSLASEGKDKPQGMEDSLVRLYQRVDSVCKDYIYPVVKGAKVLTGKDVMDSFQLQAGPVVGEILRKLEEAQVDGEVVSKEDALVWVKKYIENSLTI